jgi:hypothetical protein
MENELKEKQVRIRNLAPILYVSDRKTALDYYHRMGFQCDYRMGFYMPSLTSKELFSIRKLR